MKNLNARLRHLELRLNPKGGALRAIKAIQAHGSVEAYAEFRAKHPSMKDAWVSATNDVTQAVRETLAGVGGESINAACRQARREIEFLRYLWQEVNEQASSKINAGSSRQSLAHSDLNVYTQSAIVSLSGLRFLGDGAPYPVDGKTAAMIEEAGAREILPDNFVAVCVPLWTRSHFAEQGASLLPIRYRPFHGAGKAQASCSADSGLDSESIDELRALFPTEAALNDFLAGRDYSYGLADIRDEEFKRTRESVRKEIVKLVRTGVLEMGRCVHFSTAPMPFLQKVPVVEWEWVDEAMIEFAEYGALLKDKGFRLADSHDMPPLSMAQIYSPPSESHALQVAGYEQIAPVLAQAQRNFAKFNGKKAKIAGRDYIKLEDYQSWTGKKVTGSLPANDGVLARSWNSWVDAHGGSGRAVLAGVKLGTIGTIAGGARHAVMGTPGEASSAQQHRNQWAQSLWSRIVIPKVVCRTRGRRRVVSEPPEQSSTFDLLRWRTGALVFIGELLVIRRAIARIKEKNFDGHRILCEVSEASLSFQLRFMKALVTCYNASGCFVDRWEEPRTSKGSPSQSDLVGVFASEGPIDLEEFYRLIDPLVSQREEYFVDIAKARTCRMFGEENEARELFEKHRAKPSPFLKYLKHPSYATSCPKRPGKGNDGS